MVNRSQNRECVTETQAFDAVTKNVTFFAIPDTPYVRKPILNVRAVLSWTLL